MSQPLMTRRNPLSILGSKAINPINSLSPYSASLLREIACRCIHQVAKNQLGNIRFALQFRNNFAASHSNACAKPTFPHARRPQRPITIHSHMTPALAPQSPPPRTNHSAAWSIPLMCIGMGIVAVCILLPQVEANQKLAADCEKLKHDLAAVKTQLAVNDEFLKRVGGDPTLAERLAQRQMQEIRQGSSVLELRGKNKRPEISPFLLLNVAAPPSPAPYRAPAGFLGQLCEDPRRQLYFIGAGMFTIAVGLVMGSSMANGNQDRPHN
jgi:hypothetical protein